MKLPDLLPKATMLLVIFALAGCQQQKQPEGQATSAAPSGPDAKPGLAVTGGVLVLPAVRGSPGAAYFNVANSGKQSTTLAAIHIDGVGKTEMHETTDGAMQPLNRVQVNPGHTVRFARGGKHVMAFDIDSKLSAGGSTEMTLTFSGGDKVSAPLRIEAVGGGGAMTGMDHEDAH